LYKKFILNTIQVYPGLLELGIRINYVLRPPEVGNFISPKYHSLLNSEGLYSTISLQRVKKILEKFNKFTSSNKQGKLSSKELNHFSRNKEVILNFDANSQSKGLLSTMINPSLRSSSTNNMNGGNSQQKFSMNSTTNKFVSPFIGKRNSIFQNNSYMERNSSKKNLVNVKMKIDLNLNKSDEKSFINQNEHKTKTEMIKKRDKLLEKVSQSKELEPYEKSNLYHLINKNLAYMIENQKLKLTQVIDKKKFSIYFPYSR